MSQLQQFVIASNANEITAGFHAIQSAEMEHMVCVTGIAHVIPAT